MNRIKNSARQGIITGVILLTILNTLFLVAITQSHQELPIWFVVGLGCGAILGILLCTYLRKIWNPKLLKMDLTPLKEKFVVVALLGGTFASKIIAALNPDFVTFFIPMSFIVINFVFIFMLIQLLRHHFL